MKPFCFDCSITTMNNVKTNIKLVESLNNLLKRSNDATEGYKHVAEQVESDTYKDLFAQYASQRKRFADQLISEINVLGGEPDNNTSIKGDIHHMWIDIRGVLSQHNENDMLAECERGEKALIDAYEEVLKGDVNIPISTRGLLLDQLASVHSSLERMSALNSLN